MADPFPVRYRFVLSGGEENKNALAKAVADCAPGEVVYLREGTYYWSSDLNTEAERVGGGCLVDPVRPEKWWSIAHTVTLVFGGPVDIVYLKSGGFCGRFRNNNFEIEAVTEARIKDASRTSRILVLTWPLVQPSGDRRADWFDSNREYVDAPVPAAD